jgi:microcystin-dependent protein
MTTVTSLTAERMQEIEAASVVDGDVVGGHLILTRHDGEQIDAGSVVGPAGPVGPTGIAKAPIPGEIKLWPGAALPALATYGKWVWANGDPYDIATYPAAAANIDSAWNTALGWTTPGAGKFRVPDLRGLVPAGPDAMPVGSTRANRLTRTVALTIAARTGEETHLLSVPEMPSHNHVLQVRGNQGPVSDRFALATTLSQVIGQINNSDLFPEGGGQVHENVQPTVFVPYIVKLDDS